MQCRSLAFSPSDPYRGEALISAPALMGILGRFIFSRWRHAAFRTLNPIKIYPLSDRQISRSAFKQITELFLDLLQAV